MQTRVDVKGIGRFLMARVADDDRLHLHVSKVGPGERAHPPHTHEGQEIFYVLAGRCEVLHGEDVHQLDAGDTIQLDCTVLHGITNIGETDMQYAVIISRH